MNKAGGKSLCRKIPPGREQQVRAWLANYRRLKKGLDQLWEINLELVRLRDKPMGREG